MKGGALTADNAWYVKVGQKGKGGRPQGRHWVWMLNKKKKKKFSQASGGENREVHI